MVKHGARSPVGQQRWIQALNVGSYEIPSYGLVEWTETTNPETGEVLLLVKRPTQDGLLNFAINGPTPIPVASGSSVGKGLVTTHFPAYVAVDGSPVAFQTLGTQANSFYAATDRPGLLAIGNHANGRMRVTYGGVDPSAVGIPSGPITARSGNIPGEGDFMIYKLTGGALAATAFSVVAYTLGGAYLQSDVDYVRLARDFHGTWWIDDVVEPVLECETGSGVAEDTECLLTDKFCYLVGNGRVREVTFPQKIRIRDIAAENADCDDNAIGTLDLCNLPCTGSGGVDEACFLAMQDRDFVISLTGDITSDVSMGFQNVEEWSELVGADSTWAGASESGWMGSYDDGSGCAFELYLTYETGEGWVYWLNAYEDRVAIDVETCEPFMVEFAKECEVEYCVSCDTPPTDFDSVGVYTDGGDLIVELSTASVEALDCNGAKYNINFDTFLKAWSGTAFDGRFHFYAAIEQTDGVMQDEYLYHLFWCPDDQYGSALYQTSKNCSDALHASETYLTLRAEDLVDGTGNVGNVNFRFYGSNCE